MGCCSVGGDNVDGGGVAQGDVLNGSSWITGMQGLRLLVMTVKGEEMAILVVLVMLDSVVGKDRFGLAASCLRFAVVGGLKRCRWC